MTDPMNAARLSLHYASQVLAAFGADFLAAQTDYSHTALTWNFGALWTQKAESGLRVGLDFERFTLLVDDGGEHTDIALAGLSWDAALAQTAQVLGVKGLTRMTHDLPAHPLADGAPFETPPAQALAAWSGWFAHAARQLEAIAARPGASPARLWPHHFDMASLIAVDATGGEDARSVGVGFSPGDSSYADGYWYVTPWPYPADRNGLPALAYGAWHIEGWVGAILTRLEIKDDADEHAAAFLADAVTHALHIVGAK